MKKILNCTIGVLLVTGFWSCQKGEDYNEIVAKDGSKPDVVSNIKVTNYNGGAYITYSLPASGNVLYVQADYKINDQKSRQPNRVIILTPLK